MTQVDHVRGACGCAGRSMSLHKGKGEAAADSGLINLDKGKGRNQRLRDAFAPYDTNGDGMLDYDEVRISLF